MSVLRIPKEDPSHEHEDWQVTPTAGGGYQCAACGALVRRDETKTAWMTSDGTTEWELVKTQGKTVYHRRRASDRFRVTVKRNIAERYATDWLWALYDMRQGSQSGGLRVDGGTAATWQLARQDADWAAECAHKASLPFGGRTGVGNARCPGCSGGGRRGYDANGKWCQTCEGEGTMTG